MLSHTRVRSVRSVRGGRSGRRSVRSVRSVRGIGEDAETLKPKLETLLIYNRSRDKLWVLSLI